MEERRWEDLEFDCLVNVLGRVGMESLLLDVPFVCRSWHEASRSPSCWKHLVFPRDIYLTWDVTLLDKFEDYYEIHNCSEDAFIKFVVGRSHGNCTGLSLPNDCSEEVLKYIADKCPALISLSLPADHFLSSESLSILPTLIGKWEHLENLWLGSSDCLVDIITQISLACSNFSSLNVSSATIREEEASAIVTYLPNIKSLILRGARMDLKNLVIILQGCKNLVHLDVRDCRGFISGDERVLELASNIKTFMCEGSMLDDYDDGVEMEERKWEDLEFDCLVNVLGRVDMESLLLDVPFVCKSWYKASLNPSCWKHLVFPTDVDPEWDLTLIQKFKLWYDIHKCSLYSFIKFVVGRSHGNCTGLSLPDGCSEEVLKYIADECPALISLSLPVDHFLSSESLSILPTLIGKWEHLENLRLGSSDNLVDIIIQISLACSKFSSLGVSIATIGEEEASAIVTCLPNIKSLILRGARMDLENLVIILHGCRNLVHLDVRNCTGFNSDDERVLELASNIKTFMCEGSMLADYDDYDIHGHDYFYECFDG